MQLVPLIAGLVASAALAPALLRGLEAGRHVRTNYRGTALPCPFGLLIVLGVIFGAALASVVAIAADDPDALPVGRGLAFVFGVAFLGLVDDQFTGDARGLRGHLRAALRGEFSTGALKALGTVALALYVVAPGAVDGGDLLDLALYAAILVLATNLFNLFDLRPGRTLKAFALVALACVPFLESAQLQALGLFAGPVLVAGLYDLRERAMLGDTGSNVIGAIAGLFLVDAAIDATPALSAPDPTAALGAIAGVLLLITLYGELRSINTLVESTPGLRHLDSLGRPA